MKLELSIANDSELRAFIKESVKNALVSISRDEVKSVVSETLAKSTKLNNLEANLEQMIKEEIRKRVLQASLFVDLKKQIEHQISERTNKMIENHYPEEKIKDLINGMTLTAVPTIKIR